MKPIISIITPIYNGVVHIENYFKNIRKIQEGNVEFILINDGSTDDTHEKLLEKFKKFSGNFLYIQQENTGAAGARLNGIRRASGDYIALLDCDDEFGDNAILSAIEKIKNYPLRVDCVLFDLKYKKNNILSNFKYSIDYWPINGKAAFAETVDKWGLHGFGVFRKTVYLTAYAVLDKLAQLSENRVNDDELITRIAFYNCNYIDLCHGTYLYNVESPSTTRGYNKNSHKMLYTSISLINFINNEIKSVEILNNAYRNLLNHTLAVHRSYIVNFIKIKNKEEWKKSISSAICKLDGFNINNINNIKSNKFKEIIKKIHLEILFYMYK
ncbi:MAG: glycosyltransferase family 2 protein [Glaciimonas sp.]|nr:glycosyltransferase family 2 protein [Glaciimonas sp.]